MKPPTISKTNGLFSALVGLGLAIAGLAQAATPADGELLKLYRSIQSALAKDQFDEAKRSARELEKTLDKRLTRTKSAAPEAAQLGRMKEGAKGLAAAGSQTEMRRHFGQLSEAAVSLVKQRETLLREWKLFQCPMVKGYGYWLQPQAETVVMNPYMGSSMQQCGMAAPLK